MGKTWDNTGYPPANGPRNQGHIDSLSDGLYGSNVPPGFDPGPGRFLGPRDPGMARVLSREDYPGSAMLDQQLAGDQPDITRQSTVYPDTDVPGQLYGPPDRKEIQRDGTGGGQLVRRIINLARRPRPEQPANEIPGETNPPRREDLQVHHDGRGGSQMIAPGASADHSVAGLIGSGYFLDGRPAPPPGPACEWCHETMSPGPAGSNKRFCSPSHKAAWHIEQKKMATATP